MWCSGKFLLLIIGSSLPSADERWLHFLLLLKIVDTVFLPVVSVDDLASWKVILRSIYGSLPTSTLDARLFRRCNIWCTILLIFTNIYSLCNLYHQASFVHHPDRLCKKTMELLCQKIEIFFLIFKFGPMVRN